MADGKVEIKVTLDAEAAKRQAANLGKQLGDSINTGIDSAGKDVAGASERIGKGVAEGVSKGASQTVPKLKKQINEGMTQIGESLETLGGGYTKAVSVPIAAAAVASGAAAIKIDTALTGVRKTVDGTEQQYEALKQSAIDFSKTNAVDPAQILDVQALGAQLGFTITELDDFGEVVSGLDIATNMDAETAAMELAQFANIMQMSHGEVSNYGSTIVDLGNKFATTESDVSHMAMRIAGSGKQIGMSEADVLGLATALSSLGIKAEAGGSAISTIMSTIDKDVATNSENLATWAETAQMTTEDFANAWKNDPVQALQAVLTGMDAAVSSGGNMNVMLGELGIESIRQTDTLKRLAGGGDLLARAVDTANTAWEENTALSKEVENRNGSLESQLRILWNRVQAVAIEFGGPLVEALISVLDAGMPLVETIADVAEAFSEMDEDQQRSIIGMVAAAAAMGPLVTGIGKVIPVASKAREAYTKLADGFKKTADASSNLKKPISDVGDASQKAADKTKKLDNEAKNTANQLKNTGDKAKNSSKNIDGIGDSAKDAAKEAKGLGEAAKGAGTQAKNVGDATQKASLKMKVMSGATSVATTAVNLFKSALMTVAPIAAVAVIGAVVEHFASTAAKAEEAAKETRELEEANKSLAGAIETYSSSYADAAGRADVYSKSVKDIVDSAQDAIDKQIELGDAIKESFTDVGTNSGLLDIYMDSIERLGGKTNLTAAEQAELQQAIKGVNDITGSTYEVIDTQNGKLSENKDKILATAEAWKQRAYAEATQEALSDVLKQQVKVEADLADVSEKRAQKQDEMNALIEKAVPGTAKMLGVSEEQARKYLEEANAGSELGKEIEELTKKEDELKDSKEANQASIDRLTEANEKNLEVLQATESAITAYVAENDKLKTAIEQSGVSTEDFSKKLSEVGISTQDLSVIMEREGAAGIEGFMDAYLKGGDNLIQWCKNTGIEIPATLADGIEESAPKAQEAAEGVTDGVEKAVSNSEPGIHQSAYQVGIGAGSGVGEGMAASTDSVRAAMEALGYTVVDSVETMSDTGQTVGFEITTSMGTAIIDSSGNVTSATGELSGLVGKDLSALEGDFSRTGTDATTGMGQSIEANKQVVNDAVSRVNSLAKNAVSGLPSFFKTTGSDSSSGLSTGMVSGTGKVSSSAGSLNSAARNPLTQLPGWYGQTGTNSGSRFGTGIGTGGIGPTRSSVTSITNEAKGINKYERYSSTWGRHLGNNFAAGIAGAVNAVTGAANNILEAAKSILGFSVPKQGPFSGAEKGGETSGRHLAENFARGLAGGADDVRDAAEEVVDAARGVFDGVGSEIADAIVVDFNDADPMAQLMASVKGGISVANMVVAAQAAPTNNSYRQTVNFNQPVQSPDQIARTMRMQQRYGLAGRY